MGISLPTGIELLQYVNDLLIAAPTVNTLKATQTALNTLAD